MRLLLLNLIIANLGVIESPIGRVTIITQILDRTLFHNESQIF